MKNQEELTKHPSISFIACEAEALNNMASLSDAELKLVLEKMGYRFTKKFCASPNYLHRRVADMDVLLSIGGNIVNFNGYIEMNRSAAVLWDKLQQECSAADMEQALQDEFNISHEKAVEDVLDFLKFLQENNMVTVI